MRATPSITRLFAATFIAVALVGLVTQKSRRAQRPRYADGQVELAQLLDRISAPRSIALIAAEPPPRRSWLSMPATMRSRPPWPPACCFAGW